MARPKTGMLGAAGLSIAKPMEKEKVPLGPPPPTENAPVTNGSTATGATEATDFQAQAPQAPPPPLPDNRTTPPPSAPEAQPRQQHRNAGAAIKSGEVTMRTVYLTTADRDRLDDAALRLKKTHRIKGQVGFSLVVRVAAKLLEDELERDPDAVVDLARGLTER